jgi:hypothetical protein
LVDADRVALEDDINDVEVLIQLRAQRRRRRPRRWWTREWVLDRPLYGQYEKLMTQLTAHDQASFRNFVRVDPDLFHELLQRIAPRIERRDTNYRKALDPGLKLAITMRYLATGDSYHSLMYGFRVPHNTISLLIPEVCRAIVAEYAEEVITCPTTEAEWRQVADLFERRWNFSHVLGALDGKHVAMRKPKRGGSLFYNYKGFHSIVLMALVDADYKFLWVDIGSEGASSDAGIFKESELKELMENEEAGVPDPDFLPHDDERTPYFIIGDDAFPLRTWLMNPYAQRYLDHDKRIFNYRLSRARRVVENAFGILAHRLV